MRAYLVHHIPKLRSYFAEFLRYHFPNRLSMQCQPTCVGFRYGLIQSFSCATTALTARVFSKFRGEVTRGRKGLPAYFNSPLRLNEADILLSSTAGAAHSLRVLGSTRK